MFADWGTFHLVLLKMVPHSWPPLIVPFLTTHQVMSLKASIEKAIAEDVACSYSLAGRPCSTFEANKAGVLVKKAVGKLQ